MDPRDLLAEIERRLEQEDLERETSMRDHPEWWARLAHDRVTGQLYLPYPDPEAGA